MTKFNVLLIVEGNEENAFFEIVKQKGVHQNINLEFFNAEGFGNIGPYYQAYRTQELFDSVLCVYDVDYRQDENESPYNSVRRDLKEFHGSDEIVTAISFCTNPNILQFFLLGCDTLKNVELLKTSKKENSVFVHKYWNEIAKPKVTDDGQDATCYYQACEWQLNMMRDSYIYDKYSYDSLLVNANDLSVNYLKKDGPGSNLTLLLNALKNGNVSFFQDIEKIVRK